MFKGVEVPEHSLVVRETIGTVDADTLMCESDYSPCCYQLENGWFYDFDINGSPSGVDYGMGINDAWYQTPDDGVVRLHYDGGANEGIFFCRIRVSTGELQTLYVGVYPSVDNGGADTGGDGKSVNPVRDPSHCSIKPGG